MTHSARRRVVAVAATFVAAATLATCSEPTAPKRSADLRARFAFAPTFSPAAQAVYAQLAQFGLEFDRVRIVIVRPPNETVLDTTVTFRPGQKDTTLDLSITVKSTEELFAAKLQYRDQQGVLFEGNAPVRAHAPDAPAPPFQVTITYVGPGSTVARIAVSPKNVTLSTKATQTFTMTAFDSAGAVLTNEIGRAHV